MEDKHQKEIEKLKKALKASRENYRCQKNMKEAEQRYSRDLLCRHQMEQVKMVHLKELLVEVCADYSALMVTNKKLRQQSGD
jgi:predicted HicB family RNase H-like nuclease